MKLNKSGHMLTTMNATHDGVPDQLVKPAILVHAGEFQSKDGPISFDEARIKRVVQNHNAMIEAMVKDYGGTEKTPIGAYPALLDSHSDESNDKTIGRLAGLVRYERRDIPKVGKNVPCVCSDLTFIGKGTCEMVIDGRIYHLSVGIDEETDTLGEVSTVIVPAAAGAMLLKKGTVDTKVLNKKLSKGENMNLKQLGAVLKTTKELSAKVVAAKATVNLAARQTHIRTRLGGLMKSGKLTPAEFKQIEIKKLAKLDDETLKIALSAFEAREDRVIAAGQAGSSNAVNALDIAKAAKASSDTRMRAEVKSEAKRLGAKIKLSKEEEEALKDKKMSHEEKLEKKMAEEMPKEEKELGAHTAKMDEMSKCLEEGDVDGAKKHLEDMRKMKHMSAGELPGMGSEEEKSASDDMQRQVDELHVQVAKIVAELEKIISAEQKEGHTDLAEKEEAEEAKLEEEKGEEEKKLADEPEHKDEEKKDLADDEEKKDEKKLAEEDKKVDEKKLAEEVKKDLSGEEEKDEKKLSDEEADKKKAKLSKKKK